MAELYVHLRNWLQREEGQDLAEYALLIGLIALVAILAVTLLGENLSQLFSELGSTVGSWW
jgi:pilus assembly protein Flp/PilA